MNFCWGVTIEIKFYHVTPSMVYVIMWTKVVPCNNFAREAVIKKLFTKMNKILQFRFWQSVTAGIG